MKRLLKIGRRIKMIRESKKITQEELSKLASVNYCTLCKVENEKTKNPSSVFCAKVADALGVNLEAIVSIEYPHVTMDGCSPFYSGIDDVLEYL